jgi:hypothetical protein
MKRNRNPTPIGTRFGMLVVTSYAPVKKFSNGTARRYECKCDCGGTTVVIGNALRSGVTSSCGCRKGYRHGESEAGNASHEYRSLSHIIQRCTNPNHESWKWYGGRGIKICEQWDSLSKIKEFIKHVGRAPSPAHSIERINNNGNYEPGNVKWATPTEQARNMRSNRLLTINGEIKCVAAWLEFYGITYSRFYHRVKKLGWPPEAAIAGSDLKI